MNTPTFILLSIGVTCLATFLIYLAIGPFVIPVFILACILAWIASGKKKYPIELKDKKNKKKNTADNIEKEKLLFHKSYISFENSKTNSKFYRESNENTTLKESVNKIPSRLNPGCNCIRCQRNKE